MKLTVQKKYLSENPESFIRSKASYGKIHSQHTGHDSYVRHFTRDHYPRLHMYIKDQGDSVVFDLHLDQKQASYHGSRMHNAEHDGPVVEGEIARIKGLIQQNMPGSVGADTIGMDASSQAEKSIGHGDFRKDGVREEKKSFWKRIFG